MWLIKKIRGLATRTTNNSPPLENPFNPLLSIATSSCAHDSTALPTQSPCGPVIDPPGLLCDRPVTYTDHLLGLIRCTIREMPSSSLAPPPFITPARHWFSGSGFSLPLSIDSSRSFTSFHGRLIRDRLVRQQAASSSTAWKSHKSRQTTCKYQQGLARAQVAALDNCLQLDGNQFLLEGFAGSGKSASLKSIVRSALKTNSFRTCVLATTKKNADSWREECPGANIVVNHKLQPYRGSCRLVIVDEALLHSFTKRKYLRVSRAITVYLCDRLQNDARPGWLPPVNDKYLWRTYRPMPRVMPIIHDKLLCLAGYTYFSSITDRITHADFRDEYFSDVGYTGRQFVTSRTNRYRTITGVKNAHGFSYASLQGLTKPCESILVNRFPSTHPTLLHVILTRGIPEVFIVEPKVGRMGDALWSYSLPTFEGFDYPLMSGHLGKVSIRYDLDVGGGIYSHFYDGSYVPCGRQTCLLHPPNVTFQRPIQLWESGY